MLRTLDKKFHLRTLYSSSDRNPFWRLYWAQTDENFLWFYQHMVEIDADTDVGIMTIDVLDYDKVRSHQIAETITQESEKFINDINTKMQTQTMRFARTELDSAVKAVAGSKNPQEQAVAEMRLTAAQQALASAEGGREPADDLHRADLGAVAADRDDGAAAHLQRDHDHGADGADLCGGLPDVEQRARPQEGVTVCPTLPLREGRKRESVFGEGHISDGRS